MRVPSRRRAIQRPVPLAGLVAILLWLWALPLSAAECAHLRALIDADQMQQAADRLELDRHNRACAYYLAVNYRRRGDVEAAVQWVNFARLFVVPERDLELYTEILYLKLLLAPDGNIDFPGLTKPRPYDPHEDSKTLRQYSPQHYRRLLSEVTERYDQAVAPYREDPWNKNCPRASPFWKRKLNVGSDLLAQICDHIGDYNRWHKTSGFSREKIDGVLIALETLERLEVRGVEDRIRPYRARETYFEFEQKARRAGDHRERVRILGQALAVLDGARIKSWDPASVRARQQKYSLTADIDDELARRSTPPAATTVESWKKRMESLPQDHTLDASYSTTVRLLARWQDCRGRCLAILCRFDPCRLFIEDERSKDSLLVGSALIRSLRSEVRQNLEDKIARAVREATEYLEAKMPSDTKAGTFERIGRFLSDLMSEYDGHVNIDRIEDLETLYNIDTDLKDLPSEISRAPGEILQRLADHSVQTAPSPAYRTSLTIVHDQIECVRHRDSGLLESDPCLRVVESPSWEPSAEMRRRRQLEGLRTEALNILEEKSTSALQKIAGYLERSVPLSAPIRAQAHLLTTSYRSYADTDQLADIDAELATTTNPTRATASTDSPANATFDTATLREQAVKIKTVSNLCKDRSNRSQAITIFNEVAADRNYTSTQPFKCSPVRIYEIWGNIRLDQKDYDDALQNYSIAGRFGERNHMANKIIEVLQTYGVTATDFAAMKDWAKEDTRIKDAWRRRTEAATQSATGGQSPPRNDTVSHSAPKKQPLVDAILQGESPLRAVEYFPEALAAWYSRTTAAGHSGERVDLISLISRLKSADLLEEKESIDQEIAKFQQKATGDVTSARFVPAYFLIRRALEVPLPTLALGEIEKLLGHDDLTPEMAQALDDLRRLAELQEATRLGSGQGSIP